MDINEKKKSRPRFQSNFVANLLERDTGRDRFNNKPVRNSYHHSYQLLSSLYPDHLEPIDLNRCEPPNAEFPLLSNDADCLGFSPDGQYLAFHSHGHSSVTVLKYYGVEGSKNDKSHPMSCFAETTKVDMGLLTRGHHYKNEKATRSWWTDDSTTIILQLTIEEYEDEEEEHDEPEEDVLLEVDDITADMRGSREIQDVPNPLAWGGAAGGDDYDQFDFDQPQEPILPADREQDSEADSTFAPRVNYKNSIEVYYEQESSGLYEKDEFSYVEPPTDSYHRETSRTMPYYSAVESAAQIAVDEARVLRETSRTMPVYHSLISSAEPRSEETSEEGNDGLLTSNILHRIRNTYPLREGIPENKRPKENDTHMSERLRYSSDTYNRKMIYGTQPRSVREVVHNLRTYPEYARILKMKDVNASGLGYTRREAFATSRCQNKKRSYGDRFRDIFDCLAKIDYSDSVDKIEGTEPTIIFMTFNVVTGEIAILEFGKVVGQFHYHARDRLLAVSIEDSIEIYQLSDKENRFLPFKKFRLSQKDTESLQLKFHTGTAPGFPSERREVQPGKVIGDLYDSSSFHTSIQQDVATLFHKDQSEFFMKNCILTDKPTVKRIKCLSHHLLAISLSYSSNGPVQVGVIVSMLDCSMVVHPDYHEFLKLLFTHHLPDLLPRHWNLDNPSPVVDQLWFKNEIIDVSKVDELSDQTRLNSIYEFFHKTWHNPKTASNPLQSSVFNTTHAYQLYYNFLFAKDGKISFKDLHVKYGIHMEQFFHPNDPFKVIKTNDCWYYAFRTRDPNDVIVNINS